MVCKSIQCISCCCSDVRVAARPTRREQGIRPPRPVDPDSDDSDTPGRGGSEREEEEVPSVQEQLDQKLVTLQRSYKHTADMLAGVSTLL